MTRQSLHDDTRPVRCAMIPHQRGVPMADTLAAMVGSSVYEWSLCIEDHLVRGTE